MADKDETPIATLKKQIEESEDMLLLDFGTWPIAELRLLLSSSNGDVDRARAHFIIQWNAKVDNLLESSGFSRMSSIYRNVVSLVLSQLNSDEAAALGCLKKESVKALIATYESTLEKDLGCYEMVLSASELKDFGINPRLWRDAVADVIIASMVPQQQRCEICWEDFPPSDIFGLSYCQCMICNNCMREFFSVMIHDGYVPNFVCPVCRCPDVDDDTMHFQLLEPKLKFLLTEDDFISYQQRMTEWNLMKNPNFRWCINATCNFGFLLPESGIRRIVCPECKTEMCSHCKNPWIAQHEGLSCEKFAEWIRNNDSQFQEEGLIMQLQENGIDCPRCRRRYLLSKGGCIHFKCTYCHYEFCSACARPFVRTCKKLVSCKQSGGLHCHHPRNCLYYLRDKSISELQKLLDENGSLYKSNSPIGVDFCPIVEEKDVDGVFVQEACKRSVLPRQTGLCERHYKEYLAGVVLGDGIDPVGIMSENELIREIQNTGVADIPNKYPKETSDQYRGRLIRIVTDDVPLKYTGAADSKRLSFQ